MSNKTVHGAGTTRKRDSGITGSTPPRGKRFDQRLTPPQHGEKFDCSNVDRPDSSKAKVGLIPHPSSPLLLHEFDPMDMFCKTLRDKSLQLYDQLALITHLFSGPVIGPVCMYITSKEGSEDMAMQNICNIGNKIMMRVVVTCPTDKLIIKKHVQFGIDIFLLSIQKSPDEVNIPPPNELPSDMCYWVISNNMARNAILMMLERLELAAQRESGEYNGGEPMFESVEDLMGMNAVDRDTQLPSGIVAKDNE